MNKEINNFKFLFLPKLEVVEGNVLRLVIAEGQAGHPIVPEDGTSAVDEAINELAKGATAIMPGKRFEVLFTNYIVYAVANESFYDPKGKVEMTGNRMVVYT